MQGMQSMPSPENNSGHRKQIQAALKALTETPMAKAATQLLNALGYASKKTADIGNNAEAFLGNIEQFKPELAAINREKAKADRWKSCAFLFQLTNDEIPLLAVGQVTMGADNKVARGQIQSFVFLAVELNGENWSRRSGSHYPRIEQAFPHARHSPIQA